MNLPLRLSAFARAPMICVATFAASLAFAQSTGGPVPPAPEAAAPGSPTTNAQAKPVPTPAQVAGPASAAAPSSQNAANAEPTIQLTPFEVHSEKDNGYYAPNTLAGTRINSKIEDLGASISVVTKQELTDTGAVDINDIFKYESNTEGIYDYTATLSNAPTNDQIQSSPQQAVRVRGLTNPNMAYDGFYMTSRVPTDTYNLESVEISRGPNSTLFGIGQVSGTVNLNTLTANVTKDRNTISNRFDSYGGWDNRVDFNKVLFKDKLAIRVAGDYADYAYERKPSYDDVRRLYTTLTYKPFANTNIKLIYEHFKENRQTPNYLTPRDGVSEWVADGSPTWNPLTWTATVAGKSYVVPDTSSSSGAENAVPGSSGALPAGLYSNTTNYTRPSMYIDGGQMQLWEINRLNASTNPSAVSTSSERMLAGSGSAIMRGDINNGIYTTGGTLYLVPGISNKGLYDWTKFNAVSPDWNYDHASLYTATIEQELLPNLWVRGGWHLEASNSYNRNIVNPPTLQIDVNQYLLDGRPNPYYLRPFYQVNEPTIFQTPEYNDNLQAQVSYDLNFRDIAHNTGWMRWLGEHRILAYYESRHVTNETKRFREVLDDPNHSWLTAGALDYTNGDKFGHPTYRYYVGPKGALTYTAGYTPPKSGVQGTFNMNYNLPSSGWVADPSHFGQEPYVGGQTEQEITSRGFATQSFLLNDRIVITGGIRNDFDRTRNSNGATLDGTTGVYDYGSVDTWQRWANSQGYTRTIGIVLKPTSWLGIFADKSDSFQPQSPAVDLFDEVLPNTYGHGQDMGAYLSFFGDRLVVRGSVYKTTIINDRSGDTTIGSRIMRLDTYDVLNIGGVSDRFSFQYWAYNAAANKLGLPYTGTVGADPRVDALAKSWLQYPASVAGVISAVDVGGDALRGVDNTIAKGAELEVDYNPTYNLTFKLTGAQTKAVQTTLENDLTDYIAERMPVWKAANDGLGDSFWNSTKYSSTSASSWFTTNVASPLEVDQALLGKSNPQVKEYTWRALGKYRFTSGLLNHFSIGGTVRWDSKSVIGYLGSAPDADGVVRSLNVNSAVYDPARYSGDMFAAYQIPIYGGKVGLTIQLNWQNAFQTAGLRVINVNPDGTPYNYRIIDPQQFALTTTLTF